MFSVVVNPNTRIDPGAELGSAQWRKGSIGTISVLNVYGPEIINHPQFTGCIEHRSIATSRGEQGPVVAVFGAGISTRSSSGASLFTKLMRVAGP